MTAIEEIEQRLARYPHLTCTVRDNAIKVDAPSPEGFDLVFVENSGEWIVFYDGWHEHFDNKEEALNCFAFGLSRNCRLEVTLRGSYPYRWRVQSRDGGAWQTDSTTTLLFFPFWRRRRVEYRQNDVLAAPSAE